MGKKDSKKKFRKRLRQSTHPIPPERVEESEKGYDRSRAEREAEDQIERNMEEDDSDGENSDEG